MIQSPAEPALPNPSTRFDVYTMAYKGVRQGAVSFQNAVLPHFNTGFDQTVATNHTARTDRYTLANAGKGADVDTGVEHRGRIDKGRWMNRRLAALRVDRMEQARELAKGSVRVSNDHRKAVLWNPVSLARMDQDSTCPSSRQRLPVLAIVKKADLIGTSRVQSCDPGEALRHVMRLIPRIVA